MDPTQKIVTTNPQTANVGSDKPQGIPSPKQDFEKIMDDQKRSKSGQGGSQSFTSASSDEEAPLPSPFDLPKARPATKGEEPEVVDAPIAPVVPKKGTVVAERKSFSLDEPVAASDKPMVQDKPIVADKPMVQDKPVVADKSIVQGQPVVADKPIVKDAPVEQIPIPVEVKPAPVQERFTTKKGESKLQFSKEMPDLSQVNPLGAQVAPVTQGVAFTDAPVIPRADINKIIAELVDSIQTMTNAGQTETTVTLKGTPLLEGAKIVITSFASASKEFNVAFENLSPDAKRIMDIATNQQALMTGFRESGMVLHIITTNTQSERPIYTGESSQGSFSRERGEGGGGSSGEEKERRDR